MNDCGSEGVAGLPYSYGKRFCSLDDYLAYLETHAGPVGQPWWQQIEPGVYREVSTATDATQLVETRAQLAKRYGFSR